MRRFSAHNIGVEQGERILFSDFENDGNMWSGNGPRESRVAVTFAVPFQDRPVVQVGISMWDMDRKTNLRADIAADKVTVDGFDIVFRTWGDTRVARIRASWTALGPLPDDDAWDVG